jgi:hypothetical protein
MGVSSTDSSAAAWAESTLAAAEAYAIDHNDAVLDRPRDPEPPPAGPTPVDGVDSPPPDNPAGQTGRAAGQNTPGGAASTGTGSTSTAGSNGASGSGTAEGTPVALSPSEAADLTAAGLVVTPVGDGTYVIDTGTIENISIVAPPEPPPPSIVILPDYNGGDTNAAAPNDSTAPTPAEERPPLPQEPGLEPSPIQLDDLLLLGGVVRHGVEALLKLGGKLLVKEAGEKIVKEGVEAAGKKAGQALGKEGVEAAGTKATSSATGTAVTEGASGSGKAATSAGGAAVSEGAGVAATAGVPKPVVENPKLSNLVEDLYKGAKTENPIGTGSTADAIRHEAATGEPVGGKWHTQKGEEYARALEKWLQKNPDASESDRSAAQAILDDLHDALGD